MKTALTYNCQGVPDLSSSNAALLFVYKSCEYYSIDQEATASNCCLSLRKTSFILTFDSPFSHVHTHTTTPSPSPPSSIHREGIYPPPDVITRTYSSVAETLETGDIVLFSGATSSGAIIKFFDRSQFSHIGLVRN